MSVFVKLALVVVACCGVIIALMTLRPLTRERARHHIEESGGVMVFEFVEEGAPFRDLVNRIDLTKARAVDSIIPNVKPFPELSQLQLSGTELSDVGLQLLGPLSQLSVLELSGTRISDRGVASLTELPELELLLLNDVKLTDQSADRLAKFSKLKVLELAGTGITDASIEKLGTLTQLQLLVLPKGGVTAQGRNDIKKTLRRTEIRFE